MAHYKFVTAIVFALLFTNLSFAQVKSHKKIDELYQQFRVSYQKADSAALSNLYWEDAAYIWSNTAIDNGRSAFMKNFGSFFRTLKNVNDSIDIVFQIEKREFSNDGSMCTDVGYFVYKRKGSKEQTSTGKMVNVFTKRKGEWRFLVDMSGEAPKEVFIGTGTITKKF